LNSASKFLATSSCQNTSTKVKYEQHEPELEDEHFETEDAFDNFKRHSLRIYLLFTSPHCFLFVRAKHIAFKALRWMPLGLREMHKPGAATNDTEVIFLWEKMRSSSQTSSTTVTCCPFSV